MGKFIFIICSLIFILILVGIYFNITHKISNEEVITITVIYKEIKGSESGDKYLIYTKNEVFENTDNILLQKFNSSDIFGQLIVDSTYQVRVAGIRIEFLNKYRNIIEVIH